jgi:hypothetical protein
MTNITVLDAIPNVGRPHGSSPSRHIERVNRTIEENPDKYVLLASGPITQRPSLYALSAKINRAGLDGLCPGVTAYTRTMDGEVHVYVKKDV